MVTGVSSPICYPTATARRDLDNISTFNPASARLLSSKCPMHQTDDCIVRVEILNVKIEQKTKQCKMKEVQNVFDFLLTEITIYLPDNFNLIYSEIKKAEQSVSSNFNAERCKI